MPNSWNSIAWAPSETSASAIAVQPTAFLAKSDQADFSIQALRQ
jgi:hypothetical protein